MNTSIPAGAGEIMQYIVHPFNDNTIRFVLRYPGILPADALRQAVFALVSRIDVLHASFSANSRNARWEVGRICGEDCFTCMSAPQDPSALALEQALQPIAASSPVQMRCILVQGAAESALVLLISHLCADGSDGKYLLRKLCEACRMILQTGSCAALEVKNGSRAAEQVYAHLSRPERLRLLKDPRAGIRCAFPFPTGDAGVPSILFQRIPARIMTAAHEKARGLNATVNDLLLTACYYAYAETAGLAPGTPVSILSMMDLRRHCEGGDSQGLCNLTGPLSTALPDGLPPAFSDGLAIIAAQTRRSKEDPFAGLYGMPLLHGAARTLPLGMLTAASSRLYGSLSLGLTNVGNLEGSALQIGGMRPAEGWFGGPVKRKPGVQVSAASFDGACTLCLWGDAAEGDKALLQRLLDSMTEHIAAFAQA